jgi:murein DD-endopeptidase MepM/ murein hydrolase activator NlpD
VRIDERTGQTIAAVGNNGATIGPQLHFQLIDNTSFALAEGVPYEFDSFVLVGHVNQKTGRQLLPTPCGAPALWPRYSSERSKSRVLTGSPLHAPLLRDY